VPCPVNDNINYFTFICRTWSVYVRTSYSL